MEGISLAAIGAVIGAVLKWFIDISRAKSDTHKTTADAHRITTQTTIDVINEIGDCLKEARKEILDLKKELALSREEQSKMKSTLEANNVAIVNIAKWLCASADNCDMHEKVNVKVEDNGNVYMCPVKQVLQKSIHNEKV